MLTTHMGCVDELNTGHSITLRGVVQETAVDTQNKTTEKNSQKLQLMEL